MPDMTRHQSADTPTLAAIRDEATRLAARYSGNRARDLRHIAMDAQAALDGCPASLDSVREFVAGDHELTMATLEGAIRLRALGRCAA